MIQARSSRLGCGMAQCGNGLYAYCNYVFSQTPDTIKYPYTSGISCSKCTPGMCSNNLCKCNKNCLNYGTLDQTTCSCKCKPYATGNECEVLLCDKKDKDYGCWGSNPQYCRKYLKKLLKKEITNVQIIFKNLQIRNQIAQIYAVFVAIKYKIIQFFKI